MPARLSIEAGEGTPRDHELVPGLPVTLGRHRNNTIVVHDEHASRWHAVILHESGRWIITNIGNPVNGTRLNGERLSAQADLHHGHEIAIGDTRLRFTSDDPAETVPTRKKQTDPEVTPLPADELTVLCNFMAEPVEDARGLIHRALDTMLRQTQATVSGFLSLDAEDPLPKMICPENAQVDVHLSRQLTARVQKEGHCIRLSALVVGTPLSDSLLAFSDALCLPLGDRGSPLGALHLYKAQGFFGERHQRFCEVMAGYLVNSLHVLRARRTLEAENLRLRSHSPAADDLIGNSPGLQQLRQVIARVAPRSSTVLIQGESGVGKELVALALHRQSPRGEGPLVVVNCAAITATLPEAELFGHCKGAFTGADRDRPGLFQQADEGTLFLDEIGELPADCQAKLLRVIEGKGFRPVGATSEVQVDVRIIAATNRNLDEEVRQGNFRADLCFRLQVIPIEVPPLREHAEDIPALVEFFLAKLGKECRRPVQLTAAALGRLRSYGWPGNVRQLWAVLESAVAMSDSSLLDAADLPLPAAALSPPAPTLDLEELETWAIRQALRQTRGNITGAARLLGVVRDTLSSKMKKKGITRKDS